MLKTPLLHPEMLSALGAAGHNSKILIADGNFPHCTKRGPNARLVFANFTPGVLGAVDVLKMLLPVVSIESAAVMQYARSGPAALKSEPPIWADFRRVLKESGINGELTKLEQQAFYAAAGTPDVCLAVATAEVQIYANLLLTVGVVK